MYKLARYARHNAAISSEQRVKQAVRLQCAVIATSVGGPNVMRVKVFRSISPHDAAAAARLSPVSNLGCIHNGLKMSS